MTPAYQLRVIDEKAELDTKIRALHTFINGPLFNNLPEAEIDRLMRQDLAMIEYSGVLGERIAAFQGVTP